MRPDGRNAWNERGGGEERRGEKSGRSAVPLAATGSTEGRSLDHAAPLSHLLYMRLIATVVSITAGPNCRRRRNEL